MLAVASLYAPCHSIDFASEILYNVNIETNITSQLAKQAKVKHKLGFDDNTAITEVADKELAVFLIRPDGVNQKKELTQMNEGMGVWGGSCVAKPPNIPKCVTPTSNSDG